ncbi:MAG: DUF120 domain-containing protein [Candidatus Diapherotrites archaeon]|uniref:Riboflavin kinase n=1 Tax=Candidatus Iainarchaeum sp. TaxID=3101447 RepID=A0A938YT59_9ARCH|nr:DUF120 domain-containing protein [Candidatus Diapherotrites archaeon]
MAEKNLEMLLFLAGLGAVQHEIRVSTAEAAAAMGISQQTASRKLRQLAADSIIELKATPSGCIVRISGRGSSQLRELHSGLQKIFSGKQGKKLSGRVKIGLGEGKYYVARKQYLEQFKRILGFKPFFGTLNLVVDASELRAFLAGMQPTQIKGFETTERSFGQIKAFKISVEGKEKAAVIFPERSVHPETEIEVIAPINLRKKFRLKEGSKAILERA